MCLFAICVLFWWMSVQILCHFHCGCFVHFLIIILELSTIYIFCISSVQPLSHVWLFATPWTAAHQASLSITNSQSLHILHRSPLSDIKLYKYCLLIWACLFIILTVPLWVDFFFTFDKDWFLLWIILFVWCLIHLYLSQRFSPLMFIVLHFYI